MSETEPIRTLMITTEVTEHEAVDVIELVRGTGLKFTANYLTPLNGFPALALDPFAPKTEEPKVEKPKRRSPRFHAIYLDKPRPINLDAWFATLSPNARRTLRAMAEIYKTSRSGLSLSPAELRERIGLPSHDEQVNATGSVFVGIVYLCFRAFSKIEKGKDIRLPTKKERAKSADAEAGFRAAYDATRDRVLAWDGDRYIAGPDIEKAISAILWGLPAIELIALHHCLPIAVDAADDTDPSEAEEDTDEGADADELAAPAAEAGTALVAQAPTVAPAATGGEVAPATADFPASKNGTVPQRR